MAYPWTFNSETINILIDSITNDQAASITVRKIPYGTKYIIDDGGLGPETIGMTLSFRDMATFQTFRSGAGGVGTHGGLNWMFGVVPDVLLKSLSLRAMNLVPGLPVEADAQFVVNTPISSGGTPAYDSSLPWSFTLTGGAPATLVIPGAPSLTDDYATEETTRQLSGSGAGPSWFLDTAGLSALTIHLSLSFPTAADFITFRLACLDQTGALVYPGGSVTLTLLSKLSVSTVYLDEGYPVIATADFLVITP